MTPYLELRERVLEANREIVRAGLVILTFGNASGVDRSAGVMAIKPSGVPYDELEPESIVLVDLESGQVTDGESRPSSDTPTHLVLYRRFEGIGGVVHTHSPFATAWAQAGREPLTLSTQQCLTTCGSSMRRVSCSKLWWRIFWRRHRSD